MLGMVEVGLVVCCFWRRWLLWAAGGTGASRAIGGVGVPWAVVVWMLGWDPKWLWLGLDGVVGPDQWLMVVG